MYPQFFGLDQLPFRLRPNLNFLYSGQEYSAARANLFVALERGKRLIVVCGPKGVGKTLLLDDLVSEVEGRFAVCRLNHPHISDQELIEALALQWGPESGPDSTERRPPRELAAALEEDLAAGASPLLVIDDAHALSTGTLRALGALFTRIPRMCVLMAAQSDAKCHPEALARRMRVVDQPHLVSMNRLSSASQKAYIERRIAAAGGAGKEVFAEDAYPVISQFTSGDPRLINVLCDAALHAACTRAAGHVGQAEVVLASQDARWSEALSREQGGESAPVEHIESAPDMQDPAPAQVVGRLMVTHRTRKVTDLPLKPGKLSIGRATDNELRLDAHYISRHHCQVTTLGSVSTIEDLGSVNGMSINGEPSTRHVLQHEDRITLGEHVLIYVAN
jgi:general secretion pathway protein A